MSPPAFHEGFDWRTAVDGKLWNSFVLVVWVKRDVDATVCITLRYDFKQRMCTPQWQISAIHRVLLSFPTAEPLINVLVRRMSAGLPPPSVYMR